MHGNWWKIAKLELTLALRDKESLIWSLAAPIAMAWLFGTMFGSDEPPQPTHVKVNAGANVTDVRAVAEEYIHARGFVVADDGIEVVLPASLFARIQHGDAIR